MLLVGLQHWRRWCSPFSGMLFSTPASVLLTEASAYIVNGDRLFPSPITDSAVCVAVENESKPLKRLCTTRQFSGLSLAQFHHPSVSLSVSLPLLELMFICCSYEAKRCYFDFARMHACVCACLFLRVPPQATIMSEWPTSALYGLMIQPRL